jgi:hypothetical protein
MPCSLLQAESGQSLHPSTRSRLGSEQAGGADATATPWGGPGPWDADVDGYTIGCRGSLGTSCRKSGFEFANGTRCPCFVERNTGGGIGVEGMFRHATVERAIVKDVLVDEAIEVVRVSGVTCRASQGCYRAAG